MKLNIPSSCQIANLSEVYHKWLPFEHGTFVEIGAMDGLCYSNTSCLAELGWRGLYAEPFTVLFEACQRNHAQHPAITVEHTAVSNQAGETKFYICGECSSIVMDQNSRDWGCREDKFVMVPTCTLNSLLDKHAIAPGFELLVIDVEGAELKVLEGFNLAHYRPRMVIIEAHEKDAAAIRNWKAAPINDYFSAEYTKIQADHINSIFLRTEFVPKEYKESLERLENVQAFCAPSLREL